MSLPTHATAEPASEDGRVTAERLGYRPELDALRAVACLAVFVFHAHPTWLPGGGWVGVTAFFTLSGYLITSLLLAERERSGGVRLWRFYERRARRLLPALVVLLAVVWPVAVLFDEASTYRAVPAAGLYAGNLTGGDMGYLVHTWSLAVEEHFYVVWPLVALVVLRWRPDRLLSVTVGLACLSGAWRVTLTLTGAGLERVQHGTDVRSESILIGCAMAVWLHRGRRVRIHWAIPAVALAAFLVTGGPSFHRWINTAWFTVAAALTAVLIGAWTSRAPVTPAPLARFGKLTYGFYLWHVPVLWAFTDQPILWRMVGGFAVSYACAFASWRLVEQRWLRDLNRPGHVELVGAGPGERGRVGDERRPGADVDPFDGGRRGHDTARAAVVG